MADEELRKEIRFDYIKSNLFRIVHADGIFGGLTHRGLVWAAFWSERGAIPTQVVHEVKEDGRLGPELMDKRTVRQATIREAEVGIMMNVAVARSLRDWLDEKIKTFDERAKRVDVKGNGG